MGYYINRDSNGKRLPDTHKALALLKDGAEVVDAVFQPNLICVVSNPYFDAAGWCHSEKEFKVFNDPEDGRPKIWLVHPTAEKLVD